MIVPQYWAEAKERIRIDGHSRTLRRFGWSDASESDAYSNATERVREAAALARAGEKVRTRDLKVAYNGADGLPIREEIIERHGTTVITRNSYGALCLNTPDVLFADVDVAEPKSGVLGAFIFMACVFAGFWFWRQLDSWWPVVAAVIIGAIIIEPVTRLLSRGATARRANPFDAALSRITAFAEQNPSWGMRVYRTPNGYRVLVMHSTFDPAEEAAFDFMKALGSDRLYVRMCRNQKCFRARISPKPWRIEMEHIRPRPGIWPIKAEHMEKRRKWVSEYDRKAAEFSSCRFEMTLGSGDSARECRHVQSIHDRYSKVDSGLPIA